MDAIASCFRMDTLPEIGGHFKLSVYGMDYFHIDRCGDVIYKLTCARDSHVHGVAYIYYGSIIDCALRVEDFGAKSVFVTV